MLNINPVNFIKNNYYLKSNCNTPKLRPLAYDAVSFKGQKELTDLRTIVRENAHCDEVSENAKIAERNLKKLLTDEMQDLIALENDSNGIIEPIKTRIKDPYSIEEKVTSIITDGVKNDPSRVFQIKDQNSIKKNINDIVGARIILRQPEPEGNAPIIKSLIKMIQDKKIKVKKAEVIVPSDSEDIKPYFTDKDLEDLKREVGHNKYYKRESDTGYSALHIDLDLSDDELQAKYSGYSGEVQIMGPDVAYFKDLEDYCYKVKQGKSVPTGHPAYAPFIQHLNKYLLDENGKTNADRKKLFEEYTYKAYIIQRKKDKDTPGYDFEHLPSLEECAMADKLPYDLDFNYLQKIKKYCDNLYDLSKKADLDETALKKLFKCSDVINRLLADANPKTMSSIIKTMDKLYQLTSANNS